MDKLEKFVQDHGAEFDQNPPSHLWDRISQRLDEAEQVQQTPPATYGSGPRRSLLRWSVAAALVAGIGLGLLAYYAIDHAHGSSAVAENSMSENPVEEVRGRYQRQIRQTLVALEAQPSFTKEYKTEVMAELNDLERETRLLEADLQEDLDNEEVLQALIRNEQEKLRLLQDVLQRLKTYGHEGTTVL